METLHKILTWLYNWDEPRHLWQLWWLCLIALWIFQWRIFFSNKRFRDGLSRQSDALAAISADVDKQNDLLYNTLWLTFLIEKHKLYVDIQLLAGNWRYEITKENENHLNIPLYTNDGFTSYHEALRAGITKARQHLKLNYNIPS